MLRSRRFVLLVPLLLALAGLAACGQQAPPADAGASSEAGTSPEVWHGEGKRVEVKVHELHCAGCQDRAEKSLAQLAGVASVKADFETDVIVVTLDDAAERAQAIGRIRDEIHAQHWQVVGEDEIPAD